MVFPFTFTLNIPGISNPFAFRKPNETPIDSPNGHAVISHDSDVRRSRAALTKINRPPSLSPSPTPLSRKRGWEPSFSEPSYSTTTLASTAGYLDTPAKYRHTIPDEYHNITMSDSIDQVRDQEEGALQVHIINLGAWMLHARKQRCTALNQRVCGPYSARMGQFKALSTPTIHLFSPISIPHILSSLLFSLHLFFYYLLSSSLRLVYLSQSWRQTDLSLFFT